MPRIYYNTNFIPLSTTDLKKLLKEKHNDEVAIELILRSPISGHSVTRTENSDNNIFDVSAEEAMAIAQNALKTSPNHPIFNYVMGYHYIKNAENKKALIHLKIARQREELFRGHAAALLAQVYLNLGNYKEAAVNYFAGCQNEEIKEYFLNGRFTISKKVDFYQSTTINALNSYILIAMLLSGQKIDCLGYKRSYLGFSGTYRPYLLMLNQTEDPLAEVMKPKSPVADLLGSAISLRPYEFIEFFIGCYYDHLIPEIVFEKVLEFYADKSSVKKLSLYISHLHDKANYQLFLYALQHGNEQKAKMRLDNISGNFKEYAIDKLMNQKDEYRALIFNKLYQYKHYHEAIVFLSYIEDPNLYDVNTFNIFAAMPEFTNNFELLKLKRTLLERAMNVLTSIHNRDVATQLVAEYQALNDPSFWVQKIAQCVLSIFDEVIAEKEKQISQHPILSVINGTKSKDRSIKNYVNELKARFEKIHIDSENAAEDCLNNFLGALAEGEQLFTENNKPDIFERARHIILEGLSSLPKLSLQQLEQNVKIAKQSPFAAYPPINYFIAAPSAPLPPKMTETIQYPQLFPGLYPQMQWCPEGQMTFILPPPNSVQCEPSSIAVPALEVITNQNAEPTSSIPQVLKTGPEPIMGDLIDFTEESSLQTGTEPVQEKEQDNEREEDINIYFPAVPKDLPNESTLRFFKQAQENNTSEKTKEINPSLKKVAMLS